MARRRATCLLEHHGPGRGRATLAPRGREPLRDWNFLYVGYCTGDVHEGDNPGPVRVGGRDYVFTGPCNVGLALRDAGVHLGHIRRVLVTGVSAGGFGAAFNYDRIANAFPSTKVTLIDDSGPPLADDLLAPCFQAPGATSATSTPPCLPIAARASGRPTAAASPTSSTTSRGSTPRGASGSMPSMGDSTIRQLLLVGPRRRISARGRSSPCPPTSDGLMALRQRTAGTTLRTYYVDGTEHTSLIIPGVERHPHQRHRARRWFAVIATGGAIDVGPCAP